jgi:hypothetical protein
MGDGRSAGPGPADRFLSLPLGLCDPGLGDAYRGVGLGSLDRFVRGGLEHCDAGIEYVVPGWR